MSGQNKVDVEIFGEYYKLRGDASPEYMMKIARYVDQTMRKVMRRNPRLSIHKAAVLSAVNITDELMRIYDEDAADVQKEEDVENTKKQGEE
ncbi:MAG: cell division protein ZapA [Clostridiales bacterium]|nr:cell division protein ZapA [Clostridiales bacterium]MCF8023115.1 cell division protein ZapA [Clostridiales bacterium]